MAKQKCRRTKRGVLEVREVEQFGYRRYIVRNTNAGRDLEEFSDWRKAVAWAEENRNG